MVATAILTLTIVSQNLFAQMQFIENKGQWDERVTYMTNIGDGAVFLERNSFTVLEHNTKDMDAMRAKLHNHSQGTGQPSGTEPVIHSHAYNVEFLNSNPNPQIIADKVLPGVSNYFIGNDRSKWASGCKTFLGVTYKNIYPGIDIRYYSDGGSRLKYDIIAYPGSDINKIALKYKGPDKIEIINSELVIRTSVGDNKELYPYTYQVAETGRVQLKAKYLLRDNVVTFKISDYDPAKVLIIDPTEIFFTYTGSTADNWGFTATYGPNGNFFSGGIAFGQGYPASPGAFQTNASAPYDMAIMELNPNGSQRLFATYIGGSGKEQPQSIIADPQGNLVIAGRTTSSDYPITAPVYGPGGGWDIVLTKLSADGGSLIGSLRIGGGSDDGVNIQDKELATGTLSLNRNYGDDAKGEVVLDGANNIYLAACTQSPDFRTTAGVVQSGFIGGPHHQDGIVIKVNPNCNAVTWSTFLGGSGDDAAYVIAIGNNNSLYVAGGTGSGDFVGITVGTIQTSNAGGACDGFITELSNDGTQVLKGTYLGTSFADQIYGIETDKFGNVYVMGTTEGAWPVLNAAYVDQGAKQFISKLKPDLSAYVYSTTFGSVNSTFPNIAPTAFLVDRCQNVYVSGWGGKSNQLTNYNTGTTKGMRVTPDAIKPTTDASGSDFYFFVLQRDAASQLYGSFFGQEDPPVGAQPQTFGDHVDGGTSRFDKQGVIYQAICGNCFKTEPFFGTLGSWSPTNQAANGSGGMCNLGMIKIAMNFAGVVAAPKPTINGIAYDTVGCVPLTVNLSDTLNKGKLYIWIYGDGTPNDTTRSSSVSHVFNQVGTFRITEIAIDTATCNFSDTAYLSIRVGDNKGNLNFIANKLPPCDSLKYSFYNLSTPTRGSFSNRSFQWIFGDGTSVISAGTDSVTHTYSGAGSYIVSLKLIDTAFCNFNDTVQKLLRVSPVLKAIFATPSDGCAPYLASFSNTSLGGTVFTWSFGDGSPAIEDDSAVVTHYYPNPGNYIVSLHAFDSTTCNHTSDTSFTIGVHAAPIAAFSWSPNPPKENTYTQFTNLSLGATHYLWNFGDGETSIDKDPNHLYLETNTFRACLTAYNDFGCSRDTCMDVLTFITPLLDVPNAFTPGRFGINGVIKVIGFGITQMNWSIYNRWGERVFVSHSINDGWNGFFKGKLQPEDVYTYTLEVSFSNGKKLRKTGDITLLR